MLRNQRSHTIGSADVSGEGSAFFSNKDLRHLQRLCDLLFIALLDKMYT